MRLEWRETARNGRRRIGLRNAAEGAVAGLGAAIAIAAMEWFSVASHFPLVISPFATSIVLVIGSPQAEPAQPRALIGGRDRSPAGSFQITFPGHSCSRPCWPAPCCWPRLLMSG